MSFSASVFAELEKALIPPESERVTSKPRDSARGRGRKGRPLTFYANIAKSYAALIDAGSPRPLQVLAARKKLRVEQVRAAVAKARRLEFLSDTAEGQKSGTLTLKGERVLESSRTPRSKKTHTKKRKRRHAK